MAQGCTGVISAGSSFPNCLLLSAPGDIGDFVQVDTQKFQDRSVFGELTWHALTHLELTGGVRHFTQRFSDAQSYFD